MQQKDMWHGLCETGCLGLDRFNSQSMLCAVWLSKEPNKSWSHPTDWICWHAYHFLLQFLWSRMTLLPASSDRRNYFSRQCNHAIYQKKHWTIRMDFRALSWPIWPTLGKKLLCSLETEIYPQALTELKRKKLEFFVFGMYTIAYYLCIRRDIFKGRKQL